MLTIVDVDRAIDRLGATAFVPHTRKHRLRAGVDAQPAPARNVADVVLEPKIVLPEQEADPGGLKLGKVGR